MDVRVVAALVVVAHLEEGLVCGEVLLQGLEFATVEREVELAILKAHFIVETRARLDFADLVQVLTMTTSGDKLNTNGNLSIAVVVDLSLGLLVNLLARRLLLDRLTRGLLFLFA